MYSEQRFELELSSDGHVLPPRGAVGTRRRECRWPRAGRSRDFTRRRDQDLRPAVPGSVLGGFSLRSPSVQQNVFSVLRTDKTFASRPLNRVSTLEAVGKGPLLFNGHRASVWAGDGVLGTGGGDSCTTVGMCLMPRNVLGSSFFRLLPNQVWPRHHRHCHHQGRSPEDSQVRRFSELLC